MPAATVVRRRWSEVPNETITPFIARRYITGDRVTVAQFELKRGGIVPRHAHENEQITCVMSGRLKFVMNGQELVVGPGEVAQIPSWAEHEVHVLEDALVMDVFSPIRQDWIDKTDDYFKRPA
jgi:quercetin dioxygenase-like cupin family protein